MNAWFFTRGLDMCFWTGLLLHQCLTHRNLYRKLPLQSPCRSSDSAASLLHRGSERLRVFFTKSEQAGDRHTPFLTFAGAMLSLFHSAKRRMKLIKASRPRGLLIADLPKICCVLVRV